MNGSSPVNQPGANGASYIAGWANRGQVQGQPPAGHDYGADGLAGSVPQPPTQLGGAQQAQAAQQAVRAFPSGLQLLRDQGGVAFQAVLPAGPFLPVQVAVQRSLDGSVQAKMFNPSNPDQPIGLNAQMGSDGKLYVQMETNNPTLLILDPEKAEYGVSSPFQQRPEGLVREHAQMIAADGTKISVFNEVTTAQGKQYTQIFENPKGQVWGSQISENPQANQPQEGGIMAGLGRAFGFGGPAPRQEDPLTVQGNAQQGYTVKGGSLLGHAVAGGKNGYDGFFDYKNAPLQKWWRSRQQQEMHLMPFSAAGAGAIFPGLAHFAQPQPAQPQPAQPAGFPPPVPPASTAAVGAPPPTPPPAGPAPPSGPQPGPAPTREELMAELQQALNRNDMPAAHRLLAQLDSNAPISRAEASTLARQAVDSINQPAQQPANAPPRNMAPAAEVATSPAVSRTAPTVSVQMGDITRVPADGLITGVNSEGMWAGGVDGAIGRAGGGQFHQQAQSLIGGQTGQVKIATTQQAHQGAFKNVVFVVDDLNKPLYDVLTAGLEAADKAGMQSLSIPAMRLGVMKNVGGTEAEKIADMARAVRDFSAKSQNVKDIKFVIYGDQETAGKLQAALSQPAPAAAPRPQAAPPPEPAAAPRQQAAPPSDSYQGVTVEALVNALVNGDPNAAGVVNQIKAAADGGDQGAVAFLAKADARILEVQAQARQAAEALVAGASPEQLASARALVSKAQAGDTAEIQQKLAAAQGGDKDAAHMLQLVDAVAIMDANAAAAQPQSQPEISVNGRNLAQIGTEFSQLEGGYTMKHQARANAIANTLAEVMGLSAQDAATLHEAGQMYDIGKLDVPKEILDKVGKYTDEEFAAMKQHVAPERLQPYFAAFQTSPEAQKVVTHHHERFDGKGYPAGLAGEQIPIGARILAVADAYDAMTEKRWNIAERPDAAKALPPDVALEQLKKGAGSQFDPQVVEAFVKMVDQGKRPLGVTNLPGAKA